MAPSVARVPTNRPGFLATQGSPAVSKESWTPPSQPQAPESQLQEPMVAEPPLLVKLLEPKAEGPQLPVARPCARSRPFLGRYSCQSWRDEAQSSPCRGPPLEPWSPHRTTAPCRRALAVCLRTRCTNSAGRSNNVPSRLAVCTRRRACGPSSACKWGTQRCTELPAELPGGSKTPSRADGGL